MYSQFFGLQQPPFRITPDTSVFYSGGEREALINAIVYAISHGDGIIKVVGEVGSGKTMLSRMLASRLPDNITLVFLLNPSLQAGDLIYAIGHDLGLQLDGNCSKTDALQRVQKKLLDMHAHHQRAVVFIDEAQCMPLETLEELRLLSNLETDTDKLLQLVLFGQPELDDHLSHVSVRQIKERIIHNFYLKPFTRPEVAEYLSFRLHKAGYSGSPLFTRSALKQLTGISSGLPRKLTILADKSLLAAFAAQSVIVEASHVRLAAKDAGQKVFSFSKFTVALMAAIAASVFVAVMLLPSTPVNTEPLDNIPVEELELAPVVALLDVDREEPLEALPSEELVVQAHANNKAHANSLDGVAPAPVTLEALLGKTERWLDASPGTFYTIQILSANAADDEFLEHFFFNVARDVGLDELYVHPLINGGSRVFAITLGGFQSYAKARIYLQSLPVFIQRYQPYIKNISSFKSHN